MFVILSRSTRKWYRQLPPEKRSILMQHLNRQKYKYFGIFGSLSAAAAVGFDLLLWMVSVSLYT